MTRCVASTFGVASHTRRFLRPRRTRASRSSRSRRASRRSINRTSECSSRLRRAPRRPENDTHGLAEPLTLPRATPTKGQHAPTPRPLMPAHCAPQAVAAAWLHARSLGVEVRVPFQAASFRPDGPRSEPLVLSEDGAAIRARSLVLAPGAWLSKLARSLFDLDVPTRVSAETVCYFAPKPGAEGAPPPDHSYRSMPVFIFQTDNGVADGVGVADMGYYGLPAIDVPGIKASAHYCGPTVDPDARPACAGGPPATRGATLSGSRGEAAAAERVAAVVASTSRLVRANFPHCEGTRGRRRQTRPGATPVPTRHPSRRRSLGACLPRATLRAAPEAIGRRASRECPFLRWLPAGVAVGCGAGDALFPKARSHPDGKATRLEANRPTRREGTVRDAVVPLHLDV